MVISDRYKFLYLSNPKCFSMSCRRALARFGEVCWTHRGGLHPHTTAQEAKALFARTGREWNDYHRITTARDPLTRLVSYYTWAHCDAANRYDWMPGWNGETLMPFDDWFWRGKMFDRNAGQWTTSKAVASVRWFGSVDGEFALHKVYDERTLGQFVSDMSERVGAKIVLPHENKTKTERRDVRSYFDDAMLEQVRRDFDYEYEILGFTLPETKRNPALGGVSI